MAGHSLEAASAWEQTELVPGVACHAPCVPHSGVRACAFPGDQAQPCFLPSPCSRPPPLPSAAAGWTTCKHSAAGSGCNSTPHLPAQQIAHRRPRCHSPAVTLHTWLSQERRCC